MCIRDRLVMAVIFVGTMIAVWKRDFELLRFWLIAVAFLYLIPAFGRPDYWIASYNVSLSLIHIYAAHIDCENFCDISRNRSGAAVTDFFKNSDMPVSYTHLDVYKRQEIMHANKGL